MLLVGWGSDSPFELAPVSGKVTYTDGTPISGTEVRGTFIPQDAAAAGKAPLCSGGDVEPRHGQSGRSWNRRIAAKRRHAPSNPEGARRFRVAPRSRIT